jgi:tripartite-type tricarboxylate transporter receptor subunit TctC
MMLRRSQSLAAVFACIALLCAGRTQAQNAATSYPDRTIRVIVAFPPGGATDIIARLVAERLQNAWGKPVVVENISGATGMTGTAQGARAAPDGYTITSIVGTTTTLLANLKSNIPYDPMKDLEPLALVATFPNMLVVRPDTAKDLKDLIAQVQASPGKYTYASSGYGSSIHIAAEWFKLMTHTDILHVPYTGSSPALPALLGKHVDMMFDVMPSVWPQVQEVSLRALGVGTLQRISLAPDVPAIAETLPGFDVASWEGFTVPAGTSPDIVKKISDEILAMMKDPALLEKMSRVGAVSNVKGPVEFRAFMQADYDKWKRVTTETGIKLDK